ncbi:MAG: SCO family protein [Candidatus Dormibacter sp.]
MTEAGGVDRRSWMRRHSVALVIASALIVGVLGGAGAAQLLKRHPGPAQSQAQHLPSPIPKPLAAPFTLTDQVGKSVSLTALRGHTVLLAFLDPQCKNACPIMGQELAVLEKGLPASATPTLLVVSVAPNRTPADVAAFVAKVSWRPGWHWLLGSQAQLAPVWAAYHVYVDDTAADVVHDAILMIIDPQGRISTEYFAPLPVSEVTASVERAASSH